MIASGLSAARPVRFPYSGSPLKRVKWLQRETEHTAALAEYQGNLNLKLKALHELGSLISLEDRLKLGQKEPVDITDEVAYAEHLRRMQEAHERRRTALELPEVEKPSPEVEERLQRIIRSRWKSMPPDENRG
jgi:hypothetical protein